MRYCYTEAGKAEITLELTIADLRELRAAVKAAAACAGSTYRIQHLAQDFKDVEHDVAQSVRRFADGMQRALQEEAQ